MTKNEQADDRELIEGGLRSLLAAVEIDATLHSVIEYALLGGGKRVRPRIALAFCRDLGGNVESILGGVLALEIVHASSLIHDDLPCLDNDDMRRGVPSCHKKFGEAPALLAGDLMVALAFKSISGSASSPEVRQAMTEVLADAFMKLCSGQQLDIVPGRKGEALAQLHELKTGALFAAATAFGSLGAGFSGTVVDRAKDIGRGIGLGFQIVDDFIDLFGTSAERGRTGSSDAKNQKTTFFNNTEAGFGLGMLTDTRKRIQEMLDVFVRSIKREGAPLCETEAIIDSIFSRVAG